MFSFQLRLALKSALHTPWLSLICAAAIALGIGVSTCMTSVHYLFSRNPFPEVSARLFNVRTDSWDPNRDFFDVAPGEPPKAQSYRDMTGLMASDIPVRQTGVANATINVFPSDDRVKPYQTLTRLNHADFFSMFQAPFLYGGPWSKDMERDRARVVVLSKPANEKLFGGRDSVGETIRLGSGEFRIVGVLDTYNPKPKAYDPINAAASDTREFFMPLDLIREELGLSLWGDTDGWGPRENYIGEAIFTTADFYWIQHWVELDPDRVQEYAAFVDLYAQEQKALGRFPRPINNRVTPMMDFLDERNAFGDIGAIMSLLSYLFLFVCSINLTGLLLGKFLSRSNLVGIHRALGANRLMVFRQHLMECLVLGVSGGFIGLALAQFFLRQINHMVPSLGGRISSDFLTMDGQMAALGIALSLAAGTIAGLYPAWRACRLSPVGQLKS